MFIFFTYNLFMITILNIMSRKKRIESYLSNAFKPFLLDIVDESSNHSVPKGSESHFKCIVVSDAFQDKNRVQRHRLVNDALKSELDNGLHALSLKLFTLNEWQKSKNIITPSPDCMGGSKHG